MLRKNMILLAILLLLIGSGCNHSELQEIPLEETVIVKEQTEEADAGIYVYVCGAVENPGVYELEEGSRMFEAVQAAGGFSESAAEESVNQAEILKDEMTLYVPTKEEIQKKQEAGEGKININTASKADLMQLPGVGEAKAQQIISYRETHGSFKKVEDIMQISGIKEGLFEKIKEYITI